MKVILEMTDQPLNDAYQSMCWCCFGGGYMAIKHKVWKAN